MLVCGVAGLLTLSAFGLTLAHGIWGKVPLWVALLLLCIAVMVLTGGLYQGPLIR